MSLPAHLVPVVIKHPSNPDLCGPVVFRVPNAFTRIAIGRRASELANAGRNPKLPRLSVQELPYAEYELAIMLATLEHVVVSGPKGLYMTVNGKPVLAPGALSEFEGQEEDGSIRMLYEAYHAWRESFRLQRAGQSGTAHAENERSAADRPGGDSGGP